jgi:hypothetical protein
MKKIPIMVLAMPAIELPIYIEKELLLNWFYNLIPILSFGGRSS